MNNSDKPTAPEKMTTPETWSPEQRGRALHMIFVLANTPPAEWRSKKELYEAMVEFRTEAAEV